MNNLFLVALGFLAYKLWDLQQEVRAGNESTIAMIDDLDDAVSYTMKEGAVTARELHELWHQCDLTTLDYLKHLQHYDHCDRDTGRPVQAECYVQPAIDPDVMEYSMKEAGLDFETKRPKGL